MSSWNILPITPIVTMPKQTVSIHVVVPVSKPRRLGVFVKGIGVIQVDVPEALTGKDEFEMDVEASMLFPGANNFENIDCPESLEPGDTFHHRILNGKNIIVSLPAPSEEYGYKHGLLVPNLVGNEKMIVQGQVAPPPAINKQYMPPRVKNKKFKSFSSTSDEVTIAQELLLRSFQSVSFGDDPNSISTSYTESWGDLSEEKQLELATKESMKLSAAPKRVEWYNVPPPSSLTTGQNKDELGEEQQLAIALKESLETATSRGAESWYDASSYPAQEEDEAALLEQVIRESLATATSSQLMGGAMCDFSQDKERAQFLNSLPLEIRQELMEQETMHERALG